MFIPIYITLICLLATPKTFATIDIAISDPPPNAFAITKTDQICTTLKLNKNTTLAGCSVMNQIEVALGGREAPLTCQKSITPAISVSLTGRQLPYPLEDLRPVPANLDTDTQMQKEGALYYWYYKSIQNFAKWSPCAVNNATLDVPQPVPTDWTALKTLYLPEKNLPDGFSSIPFASVIKKDNFLVILVRGTATQEEWLIDFTYNYSTTPIYGKTHSGFTSVAKLLFTQMVDILDQQVVYGTIHNVAVAGHSLGAGVATILSALVQQYINDKLQSASIQVDALLFAAPNVGNERFNTYLGNLVNLRSLAYKYDVVPQVPCDPLMMACSKTLIDTSNGGVVKSWKYGMQPGIIMLQPSDMPYDSKNWGCFKRLELSSADLLDFLSATHICSYLCLTSQFVGDTSNWCLLSNATSTDKATLCPGFPNPAYNDCNVL